MSDFSYVTVDEIRDDLGETGNDATWLDFVKAATEIVEVELGGCFFPETDTKRYDGKGGVILFIDDLLSAAPTIVDDTITLVAADYLLYPRNGRWRNGPYFRIELDPDSSSLAAWSNERDAIAVTGKWGWYDATAAISGATVQDTTQQAAGSTTLTVQTGKIKVGMLLLIGTELEFVTAVTVGATDTCTVVRGVLGTTDAAHLNGVAILRQVVPSVIHWMTKSIAGSLWKRAKSGYTGKTIVPELGAINIFDILPKELIKSVKKTYHPRPGL